MPNQSFDPVIPAAAELPTAQPEPAEVKPPKPVKELVQPTEATEVTSQSIAPEFYELYDVEWIGSPPQVQTKDKQWVNGEVYHRIPAEIATALGPGFVITPVIELPK